MCTCTWREGGTEALPPTTFLITLTTLDSGHFGPQHQREGGQHHRPPGQVYSADTKEDLFMHLFISCVCVILIYHL